MATDYNKILLDKGYTQAQIDAMRGAAASGGSSADIVKAGQTQTSTTTPKTSTTNQTSGMNSMSQSVAQNNSRNAQVGTGDVAGMQQNQTKSTPTTTPGATGNQIDMSSLQQSWDRLSASQQATLMKRKDFADYINSKGLTVKKGETPVETTTTTKPTTQKTTTAQTPKQQQWDYQDNSQARMNEILNNLNGYRQTNPDLFKDASAFYTFFIDGKGRSQDQINYLWDYFNNVQKYSKYDNLPASSIGDGLADGSIPKDYLDYLKSIDPAKYQEAISYKQDSEDKIKYENYLEELSSMAGFESEKSEVPETSDPITYAKKMGYFVDENGDWIDDNLYIKPTDEERQDVNRINEINARRMEIKNMQKNLLDDLVEQYPGVPKATLMGIVQDRTNDISREYDDLGVELTQLQGTVDYLQNERDMQASARQDTINNLSKAYGMYYSYSPEGIAELAQSQYAATNITLDQADSGTETQKQMALENVLAPLFDKYGSIIQRSMPQVINDVIAYAKKNGIGLAQALEENFMKPLREKPSYAQLSSAEPYTVKVGDMLYQYDYNTGEFTPVNTATIGTGTGLGTMRTERNNNPTAMITAYAKQLGGVEGVDYVQGDSFTSTDENGVTHTYYTAKLIGDPMDKTIELIDRGVANNAKQNVFSAWSYAKDLGMTNEKWKNMSREEKEALILKMLQHEGGDITKMSYYNQGGDVSMSEQNSKFGGLAGWNSDGYSDNLVKDYEQYIADPSKISKTDIESKYAPMGMTYYDFTTQAQNYAKTGMKNKYVDAVSNSLEAAIELYEYINGNQSKFQGRDLLNWSSVINDMFRGGNVQSGLLSKLYSYIPTTKQYDAKSFFDTLNNRETLQKLIETKAQGATYGAMSEGEWKLLASAANMLDRNQSGPLFQKNLENLIYALSTAVEGGGGRLPSNYYNSSASKMIMSGENSGRWKGYKEDNTPFYADLDYSSYSTNGPSEI